MMNNLEKDRLIEKMFSLALKEVFSRFYRRYDKNTVSEVWAEIMINPGLNGFFNKWRWTPQMKIKEAVDSLQCCCDSIEVMIQQKEKKERKRN